MDCVTLKDCEKAYFYWKGRRNGKPIKGCYEFQYNIKFWRFIKQDFSNMDNDGNQKWAEQKVNEFLTQSTKSEKKSVQNLRSRIKVKWESKPLSEQQTYYSDDVEMKVAQFDNTLNDLQLPSVSAPKKNIIEFTNGFYENGDNIVFFNKQKHVTSKNVYCVSINGVPFLKLKK
eukprot:127606_1